MDLRLKRFDYLLYERRHTSKVILRKCFSLFFRSAFYIINYLQNVFFVEILVIQSTLVFTNSISMDFQIFWTVLDPRFGLRRLIITFDFMSFIFLNFLVISWLHYWQYDSNEVEILTRSNSKSSQASKRVVRYYIQCTCKYNMLLHIISVNLMWRCWLVSSMHS